MAKFQAKYHSILCISDQHFPYHHIDTIDFLRALKKKYRPDLVINIGDETDGHDISYHESSKQLPGAAQELDLAIKAIKPLFRLFPEMHLMDSNHGSLVQRKANTIGLPGRVLKHTRDILGAPPDWHWHNNMIVRASNGQDIYFCHNKSADVLKNSRAESMSFVQGHHHGSFEIRYWANERALYFGMTIGCLIDRKSLAFAYGKTSTVKPIVGVGAILNGLPRLLPMELDKNGRWTGNVP